jgi:hypothetical protein
MGIDNSKHKTKIKGAGNTNQYSKGTASASLIVKSPEATTLSNLPDSNAISNSLHAKASTFLLAQHPIQMRYGLMSGKP